MRCTDTQLPRHEAVLEDGNALTESEQAYSVGVGTEVAVNDAVRTRCGTSG